ncbi:hypothetical protein BD410DRAFT_734605 [Rickenella mellea]|uniref:Uncharacterized protein n=1 Tax=Rickenella mellea TaxID=50990 RepID=A0A4Y7PGC1_9AGAM|nr:hypothetical protein BD410DRAFT_734605 [Rickenella mellea]
MQRANRARLNNPFVEASPLRSRRRPSRIQHILRRFAPEHLPSRHALIHPTLTRYQLTVMLLTTYFGLSKAAYAYMGYSTVPTTLEWISGVVIGLSLYWLGLYESDPPPSIAWIFQDVDVGFVKECSCNCAVYPNHIHHHFIYTQVLLTPSLTPFLKYSSLLLSEFLQFISSSHSTFHFTNCLWRFRGSSMIILY